MSKKNLFYYAAFKRQNYLRNLILNLGFEFSSYPRMLIEVFTRKNFGERYFNLMSVITAGTIVAIIPFVTFSHHSAPFLRTIERHWLWYAYLAVFAVFSYFRWLEVKRNPSVYDFARVSYSSGIIRPGIELFYRKLGIATNPRVLEIILEPLPFFGAGILLTLWGQSLGPLLITCTVIYFIGYKCAYTCGDELIMDIADEIITGKDKEEIIVKQSGPDNTHGAKFYGKLPNDSEHRQKIADWFDKDSNSDSDAPMSAV